MRILEDGECESELEAKVNHVREGEPRPKQQLQAFNERA